MSADIVADIAASFVTFVRDVDGDDAAVELEERLSVALDVRAVRHG